MSIGWRSRIQLILTLFLMLAASPLATSAELATPVADGEPVVETEQPGPVQQDLGDEASESPESPADKNSAGASSQPMVTAQEEGEALVGVTLLICENNERQGEFDFLPLEFSSVLLPSAATTGNTSDNCEPTTTLEGLSVSFLPEDNGPAISPVDDESETPYLLPAGSYRIQVTYQGYSGTSGLVDFPAESMTIAPIIFFVPVESELPVIGEGTSEVTVLATICEDSERDGEMSFLVHRQDMINTMATGNCTPADPSMFDFEMVFADDTDLSVPAASDGGLFVAFPELESGTWILRDNISGNQSQVIVVGVGEEIEIIATLYTSILPTQVDFFVEKVWCEDDDRAGTTEIALDTPPDGRMQAAATSCFAFEGGEFPTANITLTNTRSEAETTVAITGNDLEEIEGFYTGTYVVTETIDGEVVFTSAPIDVLENDQRLRVINYVEETSDLPEPGEDTGSIYGMIMYCSSPEQADGAVEFFIYHEGPSARAMSRTCEFGEGSVVQLVQLIPVDEETGEPQFNLSQPVPNDGINFEASDIEAGTYVLGYVSPFSAALSTSEPFAVGGNNSPYVEVNVFTEPVFTTELSVYKDFCVDPARAGDATFQIIESYEDTPDGLAASSVTVTDCRYANGSDGEILFTLTNVGSGWEWAGPIDTWGGIDFLNIPGGTYTLTESFNGVEITSQEFTVDGSRTWTDVYVRNYIPEQDWEEEEDDEAFLSINAFFCENPERDGGAEFFRFGDIVYDDVVVTASDASNETPVVSGNETSHCRWATDADGLEFILESAEDEGQSYSFESDGIGTYYLEDDVIPTGEYILTERSTGATTGAMRIAGDTYMEFVVYEEVPKSVVTLDFSSANPEIANALPAGATWSVINSEDPRIMQTGNFPDQEIELPFTMTLPEPLPAGEYMVEINGAPTFEAYLEMFTLSDMPELASTQLYGMLAQQLPEAVIWDVVLQPIPVEPTPEPTVTPDPTVTPEPTADPATPEPTTDPATPEPTATATATADATATPETEVTKLPSTGGGSVGSGSSLVVMIAAVGAILATAGAVVVRTKRV